jgi:hypothetical protein
MYFSLRTFYTFFLILHCRLQENIGVSSGREMTLEEISEVVNKNSNMDTNATRILSQKGEETKATGHQCRLFIQEYFGEPMRFGQT